MSVLFKGMNMPKTGVYILSVDNYEKDKPVACIANKIGEHIKVSCYELVETKGELNNG